jgi:anaerobic magnesium-protoporphyrin IX monomethyl ester cyclase
MTVFDAPLGLLIIASHIQKLTDAEIRVNDLSGNFDPTKWDIEFADVYGLTVYAPSFLVSKKIISRCRYINPDAKIVVGGAHPTALPGQFDDLADHVVVGEGEEALYKIISGCEEKQVREENNSIVFPAYDLVDLDSYHRTIAGKPSIPYITTRGCPFSCAFCGLSYIHKISGMRFTPLEVVKEDLLVLKETGIEAINFQDDIFTLNKERLFAILSTIKELGFAFRCMGRAGLDDEEVYERLADAGCAQISWGIESGSQYILNRMNKKVQVQDNFDVIQWAKKYGINSRAFFIFGFPGETRETIQETKDFIDKADPDQFFVSNFIPYPGTPVWRNPKEFGITKISSDFSQYYQVGKDGTGGVAIETEWLNMEKFRELELEFRKWTKKRNPIMRGMLQDYEEKLYKGD